MAEYRYIRCRFWSDPDMAEMSPEDRYFYLYLLTNEHTAQCGIYELAVRTMAFETGYNADTVNKLITRLEATGKVKYNHTTHEIAIRNWAKYNTSSSPPVQTRIKNELANVKDKALVAFCNQKPEESKQSDMVSIPYGNGIDMVSVPLPDGIDTVPLNKRKENKSKEREDGKYQPLLDLLHDMPIQAYDTDEDALKAVARFSMLFPLVDIAFELNKMQGWLKGVPPSKHPKVFHLFAMNWLRREQQKANATVPKEEPEQPEFQQVGEWK